jgi:Ca2+/Na+ antiporter
MNDKTVNGVHWSFWAIGAVALIWNVLGAINYLVQMNADSLAAYREVEQAIIEGRPAWATGAFAIAVFGGTLGCLLLLLRKSAAYYLFIASLLGVIVTMIHTLSVDIDFGFGEIVGFIVMPVVVAAFLIWYSKHVESKDWISQD